jgi:hypothetical protein
MEVFFSIDFFLLVHVGQRLRAGVASNLETFVVAGQLRDNDPFLPLEQEMGQ